MSGLHFDERAELSRSKLYPWQPPAMELGAQTPQGGMGTDHGAQSPLWREGYWPRSSDPSGRDGHRPWSLVPLGEGRPPATELSPPRGGTATTMELSPPRGAQLPGPHNKMSQSSWRSRTVLPEGEPHHSECLASNWKHSQNHFAFWRKNKSVCHRTLATFCWFWGALAIETQALPQALGGGTRGWTASLTVGLPISSTPSSKPL